MGMLALGIAVLAAALIPLITGGSYVRLVMAPWRWSALLLGGFAIQIFLEYANIPESSWHTLGYGLLVTSYALILGFCFGNLLIKGMTVVMIGIACNALVIFVNQGMPVDIPPDWEAKGWTEATVKHHPQTDDDRLMFLADIIVLRSPFDVVISFGDLILAVGLCNVAFHASRKPKRRPGNEDDDENPDDTVVIAEREPEVAIDLATLEAPITLGEPVTLEEPVVLEEPPPLPRRKASERAGSRRDVV